MDYKFKIEVEFVKNVALPEYGAGAYTSEFYSVYIPYGKLYPFESSKSAINFIKHRIDGKVLDHYDKVSLINWRGHAGRRDYLKHSDAASNSSHIDIKFADTVLSL
jgi:hypothetical protein